MLHRFGEGFTNLEYTSLQLTLEQWPGGGWFRDRGNGIGHLWGHLQVIKPPVLLDLSGRLMMSYPALIHIEVKLERRSGPALRVVEVARQIRGRRIVRAEVEEGGGRFSSRPSPATTRKVRDDWVVVGGRPGLAPPRPAALSGCRFHAARRTAGPAAEMPIVHRGVADGRDGCGFLGRCWWCFALQPWRLPWLVSSARPDLALGD